MHRKLLLALAACLPIALFGCGGGGGSPASSTQTPGGTQTPAAALEAAKNAVANANSAKTAAAIEAARRAIAAAVETASTAVETAETGTTSAQAAVTKAQDYRTAQMAILDALQPINASLATVKTASTPAEAAAALTAAENAMAVATETRTAAAIDAARRALAAAARAAQAALEAAQAALEAAQAALEAAREYRDEQLPAIGLIPTQPEPPTPTPPTNFNVTHHVTGRVVVILDQQEHIISPPAGTVIPFDHSYWRTVRADARALTNGFRQFGSGRVNGIAMAIKRFPTENTEISGFSVSSQRDDIIAVGDYSGFIVSSSSVIEANSAARAGGLVPGWAAGGSTAFGERSPDRWRYDNPALDQVVLTYEGALAGVFYDPSSRPRNRTFTGEMSLTLPLASGTGPTVDYNIKTPYGNFNGYKVLRDHGFRTSTGILSDGTRRYFPRGTVIIDGNFYGPNGEEAAGNLITDRIYGAWLVKR